MATASHPSSAVRSGMRVSSFQLPVYQARVILYVGFVVLPIVAGLDKFFHYLVNWDAYLAPIFANTLGVTAHTFMYGVGVIEIVAGLVVMVWPQVGAYIVAIWLWGIIVNLLAIPGYYDIALRDFGLSLGALALGRLSAGDYLVRTGD